MPTDLKKTLLKHIKPHRKSPPLFVKEMHLLRYIYLFPFLQEIVCTMYLCNILHTIVIVLSHPADFRIFSENWVNAMHDDAWFF